MNDPARHSSDFFTDAEYLRQQAERCLQLAEFSGNPDRVASLASLAEPYRAAAERLSAARPASDREDRHAA